MNRETNTIHDIYMIKCVLRKHKLKRTRPNKRKSGIGAENERESREDRDKKSRREMMLLMNIE